ncbi:MAG: hypothetical protein V8T86_07240 [Victivallis sp.]
MVQLHDLVEGVTLQKQKRGGSDQATVMEHREDLHPQIVINSPDGQFLANYPLPAGAVLMTKPGAKVTPGMVVARVPGSRPRTRTSPAVCRASRSCSKRVCRRTWRRLPASTVISRSTR